MIREHKGRGKIDKEQRWGGKGIERDGREIVRGENKGRYGCWR